MARPYDLPSMTALVCFEAAARHLSFKDAASELNVTPAAVSHQIKGLEAELASFLFRRQHRGVELTEAGAYLFLALQRGFETISDAVQDVRGGGEAEDVTVQATTAVSAFWLTPLIAAFWKTHPEIAVSQIVSDAGTPAGRADLSVHYGPVPEGERDCHLLFQDRIVVLGTVQYAKANNIRSKEDLLTSPLMHMTAQESKWTGWSAWFDGLGLPAPSGKRFAVNNYMIALQMAEDDVGAVLGWESLTSLLIESGRLVELIPDSMPAPDPFYLRIHRHASPAARLFARWLVAASQR